MNIDDIEIYEVPEKICVVRNWFSEEEIKQIMEELQLLCDSNVMLTAGYNDPYAAVDLQKEPLKRGQGVILNSFNNFGPTQDIYNRFVNYQMTQKLFNENFLDILKNKDIYYSTLKDSCIKSVLINYYENKGEYKLHFDMSEFTAITVLWKKPKKFEGGKLVFTHEELDFNIDFNTLVIFPGKVWHGVTPIKTTEKLRRHDYSGRFSIVYFIHKANV